MDEFFEKVRESINENVSNRWEKFGFTAGLKGDTKDLCIRGYEEMANEMLSETKEWHHDSILRLLCIPLVRRVVCEVGDRYSSEKAFEAFGTLDVKETYYALIHSNLFHFNDNHLFQNIDYEAKYCEILSNAMVKVMNGDIGPKDFGYNVKTDIIKSLS